MKTSEYTLLGQKNDSYICNLRIFDKIWQYWKNMEILLSEIYEIVNSNRGKFYVH